jgi:hypothetical protein
MVLSPEKPEHSYVEKSSVYLFKEMWGIPLGIILLSIGGIGVLYFLKQYYSLQKYAWVKLADGFYFFDNRKRISGVASMYKGNDLLMFYPQEDKVLVFKNYVSSYYNKYQKAVETHEYNNSTVYWSATEKGYHIVYKGKFLSNFQSEWSGPDLKVELPDLHRKVILKDYKANSDGQIRSTRFL